DLEAFLAALVTRVEVVTLRERDRGRPDERRLEPIDRARGVTQHAVDAHAELLVLVQLVRRLAVLAFRQWLLLIADDPWLHQDELPHEVADLDDEVTNDREVSERFDLHRPAAVLGQERLARELRLAVDGHAAAAAHAHATRTAQQERT